MGIINMKWKKYINTQNKILKSIIMAERLMYLGRIYFKYKNLKLTRRRASTTDIFLVR